MRQIETLICFRKCPPRMARGPEDDCPTLGSRFRAPWMPGVAYRLQLVEHPMAFMASFLAGKSLRRSCLPPATAAALSPSIDARVLDIGVGAGRAAIPLAKNHCQEGSVHGIDIQRECFANSLETQSSKALQLSFERRSITDPVPASWAGHFDSALLTTVLGKSPTRLMHFAKSTIT